MKVRSALLGMRRRVAAWPIGIVGNVLLFTVFLGGVFNALQELDLWGRPAARCSSSWFSVYGWYRWYTFRKNGGADGVGVKVGWAGKSGLLQLGVGAVVLWTASYFILRQLESWGPAADAWILTGSILATYGMARGWVEFWLIWIAVDIVDIPLLLIGRLLPVSHHVHRLRRLLRPRLLLLVADREAGAYAGGGCGSRR